ncbi:MAG TPA: aromatic ring-hydroxylating dioxygenase subunit alpha, partial [Terriglobales bacterium]|nr:aromatic ring-hydroxylating dioxygenase subunit alpha [Terriglobales bacterium]
MNELIGLAARAQVMDESVKEIIESCAPNRRLAEATTPPSSWYTDPRILKIEQQTVFPRAWQLLARSEQVRDPGRYISDKVADEPLIVVRGNDGMLRGFYNVCRHHAAAVITQCEGRAGNLRCPYHGWTYDLTGALIHTPDFTGVAHFDRSANGLVPIQTAEWQGSVFVKLTSGVPSLKDFLGTGLVERLELLNLERMKWFERRRYTLNCNWKVFVDNYLDGGYHVPHIHGGLNSVLDYSNYTIETGARFCLQSSPIVSNAG